MIYPLSQHIGAPASPSVSVGDHVLKGTENCGSRRLRFCSDVSHPYPVR
ncbi:MAG: hypothetical protein ACLU80_04330 [Dorea sp.]